MKNCYYVFRDTFLAYFRVYNRLEVYGREHIPQEGGLIVASNHTSYLDPPLLGAAMTRRMTYIAKESLFKPPVLGKFVSSFSMPVSRDKPTHALIKESVKRLCRGEAIAMFPGGERAKGDDGTVEFKKGIELIAKLSKAMILPVYLNGPWKSLPVGAKFPRPAKITVRFGTPLVYGKDYSDADATLRILEAIRRLKNEGSCRK
jgi:1-acyl-sn-glycerol-3-phosphate acyltransferase